MPLALVAATALGLSPAPALPPPRVRDRVFHRGRAAVARAAGTTSTQRFRTREGYVVPVTLLSSLPPTPENIAKARHVVEVLDSHVHGTELALLKISIGKLAEVSRLCGGGTTDACYFDEESREFVADADTPNSDYPLDYVITHEYGHHIANHRRNDPWDATQYGPKYWASEEGICQGVRAGRFHPGDQGDHYFSNPGENWADGYALMHYPQLAGAWQYDPLLKPDAASFAAMRRDVQRPWRGAKAKGVKGTLGASRTQRTYSAPITLDGTVRMTLRGPASANFDLVVLDSGKEVARTRGPRSAEGVSATVCGFRRNGSHTLSVRVVRHTGAGLFRLRVTYPG